MGSIKTKDGGASQSIPGNNAAGGGTLTPYLMRDRDHLVKINSRKNSNTGTKEKPSQAQHPYAAINNNVLLTPEMNMKKHINSPNLMIPNKIGKPLSWYNEFEGEAEKNIN